MVREEGRGRGGDVVRIKERPVIIEAVFAVRRAARIGAAEDWRVVVGERLAVGDGLAIWWSRRWDGSSRVTVVSGAIVIFAIFRHSDGVGGGGGGGGGGGRGGDAPIRFVFFHGL